MLCACHNKEGPTECKNTASIVKEYKKIGQIDRLNLSRVLLLQKYARDLPFFYDTTLPKSITHRLF